MLITKKGCHCTYKENDSAADSINKLEAVQFVDERDPLERHEEVHYSPQGGSPLRQAAIDAVVKLSLTPRVFAVCMNNFQS
jgi:hypothetical protein